MKYKREIIISIIFISLLIIFFVIASLQNPNHKYNSHAWPILLNLGFQLIYGIGIGVLFSKSSPRVFGIGLLSQVVLLFGFIKFSNFIDQDNSLIYSPSYGEILVSILFYAPLFALLIMLIIAVFRIIKFILFTLIKK